MSTIYQRILSDGMEKTAKAQYSKKAIKRLYDRAVAAPVPAVRGAAALPAWGTLSKVEKKEVIQEARSALAGDTTMSRTLRRIRSRLTQKEINEWQMKNLKRSKKSGKKSGKKAARFLGLKSDQVPIALGGTAAVGGGVGYLGGSLGGY
jgi:hypothetical protein